MLIAIFCSLTGMLLCARVHKRIWEIDRFNRLFTVIQTQIEYAMMPTETLLKSLCDCAEFQNFPFVFSVYAAFSAGEALPTAWKKALQCYAKDSALQKADLELIEAFGSVFGTTDKSGQNANCAYYTARLTQLSAELQKGEKMTARLYLSLGVLGGLFLTILLL